MASNTSTSRPPVLRKPAPANRQASPPQDLNPNRQVTIPAPRTAALRKSQSNADIASLPSLSLALPSSETHDNLQQHRRVRSAHDFLQTPLTATATMGNEQNSIAGARPTSSHSEGEGAKKKRGKLFRKGGSKDISKEPELEAWINTPTGKIPYLLDLLKNGQKVPELWVETNDVYVYLFGADRGPSFKVPSTALSSSRLLTSRSDASDVKYKPPKEIYNAPATISNGVASHNLPSIIPGTYHLYFTGRIFHGTVSQAEEQKRDWLIEIRNLFAFLTGQPLVATQAVDTNFKIMLQIANLLENNEFTSPDGSTYGDAASAAFIFYTSDLQLSSIANNPTRIIEALILSERLRSSPLHELAYAHAVGLYSSLKPSAPGLFAQISTLTKSRLERSSLDLAQRQKNTDQFLKAFEFPSLFAGIADSNTAEEAKFVHWNKWKSDYSSFRKAVLGYYKDLYGSWPPKASSKKNSLDSSGLNRVVLRQLYSDLCSLYDFLVDREALTTRGVNEDDDRKDGNENNIDKHSVALRKLLGEFDHSCPPVLPPIPFDIPRIPTISTVEPQYPLLAPKDQHKLSHRSLKSHETLLILAKSHNLPLTSDPTTAFLEFFKIYEKAEAKRKNVTEMADLRYGIWIFLYSVIQSLPLLVVDVLGTSKQEEGVEYFLNMSPPGPVPWVSQSEGKNWDLYQSPTGGIISLPASVVKNSAEGIFRRSHCWRRAEEWITQLIPETGPEFVYHNESVANDLSGELTHLHGALSPLEPPPAFFGGGGRPGSREGRGSPHVITTGLSSRSASPRGRTPQSQRNSMVFLQKIDSSGGVEGGSRDASAGGSSVGDLPERWMDTGYAAEDLERKTPVAATPQTATPQTAGGGSLTFDEILGSMNLEDGKKGGKKKKGKK